ncbi:MAG: hypothetical protein RL708_2552 [Bacteroidota bacterium]|jgi:hypothetical protein
MKKIILLLFGLWSIFNCNAQTWSEVGTGNKALNAEGIISTITSDKNGNIYAAGELLDSSVHQYAHRYIAKWNGSNWSNISRGLKFNNRIHTIITDTKGNLYAAGRFTDSLSQNKGKCFVAKWDGLTWQSLGVGTHSLNANAPINVIAVDSSGIVYAAGEFTDSTTSMKGKCYVAKWDGTDWSEVQNGNSFKANYSINAMIIDKQERVIIGGNFHDTISGTKKYYLMAFNGVNWYPIGNVSTQSQYISYGAFKEIVVDTANNIFACGNDTRVVRYDGSNWNVVGYTSPHTFYSNYSFESLAADDKGNVYAGSKVVKKWDGNDWTQLDSLNVNSDVVYALHYSGSALYAAGQFYDTAGYPYVAKYDLSIGIQSVLQNNIQNNLLLYPNPVSNQLSIVSSSAEIKALQVSNIMGQPMLCNIEQIENSNHTVKLCTENLSSGIYFIKVMDRKGNISSSKFVKE